MDLQEYKKKYVILIVDDNEENVYTLQHRLQRDGFSNLVIARNGFQALEAIKAQKIDLVLLDIMMPEMSGLEVLDALKDQIVSQTLRVLMISSADSIEMITDCIQRGAEDFLPKPFNALVLKARIGSCIEKSWHAFQEKLLQEQVVKERSRYLELLNSVFPPSIAKELVENSHVKPKNLSNVAVVFADVVSFTNYAETHELDEVLRGLQFFIESCETAATQFHLEKIKTIGDAFMATAGMLEKVDNPVYACIQWASRIIDLMKTKASIKWEVRVGIDVGDLICGVIGSREYLFDIWGQCVNTAARIVGVANPNSIFISENAWLKVSDRVKGSPMGEYKLRGIESETKLYQIDLLEIK